MAAILSIAVVGRHEQPLCVQNYTNRQGSEADLKWHFVAHTALDHFDERDQHPGKAQDGYLGLLVTMDDHAVYGYQTNTRVKFIIAFALTDSTIRDVDVKTLFRAIHNAYISYVANPFSPAVMESGQAVAPEITSRPFLKTLDAIAAAMT